MKPFIDVATAQRSKYGMLVCGDTFLVQRFDDNSRMLAVLSDGLGSGIKASILAQMTATMALKFLANDSDLVTSMKVIMDALPVCQTRQISYATFTIVDTILGGVTRVIEMGNPRFLHFHGNRLLRHKSVELHSDGWEQRAYRVTDFVPQPEDRIIIYSDGITQAGIGREEFRLGFRQDGVIKACQSRLSLASTIGSDRLANQLLRSALDCEEGYRNNDDMTVAVIYFRHPRKLTVLAGPPFHKSQDKNYVETFLQRTGKKVICGGTTCNIVSRISNRPAETKLARRGGLPTTATMQGIDLVTEGVLTLTRVANLLANPPREKEDSPAQDLVDIFLSSDQIHFMVGTRINEAHQDPTLPKELAFRRTLIRQISSLLEQKYLKDVSIELI